MPLLSSLMLCHHGLTTSVIYSVHTNLHHVTLLDAHTNGTNYRYLSSSKVVPELVEGGP